MNTVQDLQAMINLGLKDLHLEYEPRELYDPIVYSLSIGGKRMRPLLSLMACDLFCGNPSEALPAAMAVEIFHNFTLVHDDIMDNAPLRRGKETVYKKWNHNIAILAGDTMFALAYAELGKYTSEKLPVMLGIFTTMARQVCEGQQLDMNYETQDYVSICDYIDMISLKTAALMGCSLKLGAIAGNAPEEDAAKIFTFGQNLGISFQIRDDLLDVFGEEKKFGKKTGGDIIANKKTFLYLRALEVADKKTQHFLKSCYQTPGLDPETKVKDVTAIYHDLHIRYLAEESISRFYHESLRSLESIDIEDERKVMMKNFAESLMFREL